MEKNNWAYELQCVKVLQKKYFACCPLNGGTSCQIVGLTNKEMSWGLVLIGFNVFGSYYSRCEYGGACTCVVRKFL
jgi:hypothetical protein